jgi:hypothetical protein
VFGEAGVDLIQHRFGQAILADRNDGFQGVGASTQGAALVSSNVKHEVNLFKERILQNFMP